MKAISPLLKLMRYNTLIKFQQRAFLNRLEIGQGVAFTGILTQALFSSFRYPFSLQQNAFHPY